MKEIVIKKNSTISKILDELQLSSTPSLIAVNGEVLLEIERENRALNMGDKVNLLPIYCEG
jgi:sulfur carrier protein ThiS